MAVFYRILHLLHGMGCIAKGSVMCWMHTPSRESLLECQFNQDHIFPPTFQGPTGGSGEE